MRAICPTADPVAPAAPETTTVSPAFGRPTSSSPKYAVIPVRSEGAHRERDRHARRQLRRRGRPRAGDHHIVLPAEDPLHQVADGVGGAARLFDAAHAQSSASPRRSSRPAGTCRAPSSHAGSGRRRGKGCGRGSRLPRGWVQALPPSGSSSRTPYPGAGSRGAIVGSLSSSWARDYRPFAGCCRPRSGVKWKRGRHGGTSLRVRAVDPPPR